MTEFFNKSMEVVSALALWPSGKSRRRRERARNCSTLPSGVVREWVALISHSNI